MQQPANLGEKRGLDGTGVDIVAKILQIGLEAFLEVLLGGAVGHQNTNIHLVHDALRTKAIGEVSVGGLDHATVAAGWGGAAVSWGTIGIYPPPWGRMAWVG